MALKFKRPMEGDSTSPTKRPRISSLPTPPSSTFQSPRSEGGNDDQSILLDRATRILTVQTKALSMVNELYQTDQTARTALSDAVNTILASQRSGGKLLTCAVGKSAYIARKMTATCKSLGVRASFLHACEAAHGDLGDVSDSDVLLFVSFSGRTPELLNLLPHLRRDTPLLAISGHVDVADCALLAGRDGSRTLLPAPLHESEEESFGVAAPTTSTIVALAVGDMLALTVADRLHGDATSVVFKRNHPGGAIGIDNGKIEEARKCNIESLGGLPSPDLSGMDGT